MSNIKSTAIAIAVCFAASFVGVMCYRYYAESKPIPTATIVTSSTNATTPTSTNTLEATVFDEVECGDNAMPKIETVPLTGELPANRLIQISISPESRVKVSSVSDEPTLQQGHWTDFTVEIDNAAGITSVLNVVSNEFMNSETDDAASRWLRAELVPDGRLTGEPSERRTLRLWSRDQGIRAAVLEFNAGQGTQDLGFRSDALIFFKCIQAKP